jgi:hypothetical protein
MSVYGLDLWQLHVCILHIAQDLDFFFCTIKKLLDTPGIGVEKYQNCFQKEHLS